MPVQGAAEARNGSQYSAARLRDRSGTIAAAPSATPTGSASGSRPATDRRPRQGRRFRGELTIEIDDVRRLEPGSFDPGEFLPAAYRSVEESRVLRASVREVHDPELRAVTESVVIAGPLAEDFRRAPVPGPAITPISAG